MPGKTLWLNDRRNHSGLSWLWEVLWVRPKWTSSTSGRWLRLAAACKQIEPRSVGCSLRLLRRPRRCWHVVRLWWGSARSGERGCKARMRSTMRVSAMSIASNRRPATTHLSSKIAELDSMLLIFASVSLNFVSVIVQTCSNLEVTYFFLIVNVRNHCRDFCINHIDRTLDICCALGMTAVLVLERLNAIDEMFDCQFPIHSLLIPFVGLYSPHDSLMRYCEVESLSCLDRGISPYLTVSVRLRTEGTLRYHNKHQGLQSAGCVHQLIPESVESECELNRLVTAVTDERRMPPRDRYPSAMAGKLTVHLA